MPFREGDAQRPAVQVEVAPPQPQDFCRAHTREKPQGKLGANGSVQRAGMRFRHPENPLHAVWQEEGRFAPGDWFRHKTVQGGFFQPAVTDAPIQDQSEPAEQRIPRDGILSIREGSLNQVIRQFRGIGVASETGHEELPCAFERLSASRLFGRVGFQSKGEQLVKENGRMRTIFVRRIAQGNSAQVFLSQFRQGNGGVGVFKNHGRMECVEQ